MLVCASWFNFPGYHFGPRGLTLAEATIERDGHLPPRVFMVYRKVFQFSGTHQILRRVRNFCKFSMSLGFSVVRTTQRRGASRPGRLR